MALILVPTTRTPPARWFRPAPECRPASATGAARLRDPEVLTIWNAARPEGRGQTARRRCWLAAIEGGMGAVAGEDVLAVDGEPGANPFPRLEVLAAVAAAGWQDRMVASLFSSPVIITYVDPDNVQLAQSTDNRLLPRIGENVRLGRTPYVVERIGYDIPAGTVERVWIVCRPA